jgi:hypothetical protein
LIFQGNNSFLANCIYLVEIIALLIFVVLVALYATDTGLMLAGQSGSGKQMQSSNTTSGSDRDENKGSFPAVDEQIKSHCLHMEYLASEMKVFKKNYRTTPMSFTSYGYFTALTKNEGDRTINLSYTYALPFKGEKATFYYSFSVFETSRILDEYGIDRLQAHMVGFNLKIDTSQSVDFDYPHIIGLLANSSKAIANHIRETLKALSKTDFMHFVESVRFFVNQLPYGVPDFDSVDLPGELDGRIIKRFHFGELALMPEILVLSYGDCDSKSILMVGILSELIGNQHIALVTCMAADPSNPGGFGPHMMVGVAGLPYKNTTRVSDGNTEYHLIESTCPYPNADVPFVVKDIVIHPLHQHQPELFPLT